MFLGSPYSLRSADSKKPHKPLSATLRCPNCSTRITPEDSTVISYGALARHMRRSDERKKTGVVRALTQTSRSAKRQSDDDGLPLDEIFAANHDQDRHWSAVPPILDRLRVNDLDELEKRPGWKMREIHVCLACYSTFADETEDRRKSEVKVPRPPPPKRKLNYPLSDCGIFGAMRPENAAGEFVHTPLQQRTRQIRREVKDREELKTSYKKRQVPNRRSSVDTNSFPSNEFGIDWSKGGAGSDDGGNVVTKSKTLGGLAEDFRPFPGDSSGGALVPLGGPVAPARQSIFGLQGPPMSGILPAFQRHEDEEKHALINRAIEEAFEIDEPINAHEVSFVEQLCFDLWMRVSEDVEFGRDMDFELDLQQTESQLKKTRELVQETERRQSNPVGENGAAAGGNGSNGGGRDGGPVDIGVSDDIEDVPMKSSMYYLYSANKNRLPNPKTEVLQLFQDRRGPSVIQDDMLLSKALTTAQRSVCSISLVIGDLTSTEFYLLSDILSDSTIAGGGEVEPMEETTDYLQFAEAIAEGLKLDESDEYGSIASSDVESDVEADGRGDDEEEEEEDL